jgi:hypothetical protein
VGCPRDAAATNFNKIITHEYENISRTHTTLEINSKLKNEPVNNMKQEYLMDRFMLNQ